MSEPPLINITKLAMSDFNPPLYYFILHLWMKIFGESEIVLRLLSFIFHLLLLLIVYKFSQKLKFSRLNSYCLLLTTFLNPMLIYYSFEIRMYSLLALLATSSMYFFFTKNWILYILSSALGLWTQPFMAFIIISQYFYLLITRQLVKKHFFYLLAIIILLSPWIPVTLHQFSVSGPMWIWRINQTTVTTILGNLFTGYEGTPWGLWNKMAFLSLIIIALSIFSIIKLKSKSKIPSPIRQFVPLVITWLFLPVILVLIISYFKPIYVNRYIIFVTVAEIFIITISLSLVKNKYIRNLSAVCFLLFTICFNVWFPPLHRKSDIRSTIKEIVALAKPRDLIYSQTPLTFFESKYYADDRSRVFLYNPDLVSVPLYVGQVIMPRKVMATQLPRYPTRAFLVHDDASYEVISQK
ncbi:MAG: glycosyltransferase family 39 protein [Candidatus Gottesmanbacteria bacterium]